MHYTISGTYQGGKISLNELPPFDKPSQVMVVFLDETINNEPTAKVSKRQQQLGRLSGYQADPAFYEPLDKDELEKW